MQTYDSSPDHARRWRDSIITAILRSLRTCSLERVCPAAAWFYEIGRTRMTIPPLLGDLQLDIAADDATRLYLASAIRNDPDMLVPNNLGDVLYTSNFGMTYGEQPDFDFNTLIVPKEIQEVEEEWRGSMRTVTKGLKRFRRLVSPLRSALSRRTTAPTATSMRMSTTETN